MQYHPAALKAFGTSSKFNITYLATKQCKSLLSLLFFFLWAFVLVYHLYVPLDILTKKNPFNCILFRCRKKNRNLPHIKGLENIILNTLRILYRYCRYRTYGLIDFPLFHAVRLSQIFEKKKTFCLATQTQIDAHLSKQLTLSTVPQYTKQSNNERVWEK